MNDAWRASITQSSAEGGRENTLNIDDDLRLAVKEVACRDAQSIAAVASRLLRQALAGDREAGSGAAGPAPEFGFRPFPKHGASSPTS